MNKKIFLTSAIAMGFVAPAFAAPSHTDTFPDDGYMQEDYTYTNAATADNMDDVYEGTVNAVAEYTDILYDIVAGNYLAAGSDDVNGTICPTGSYCPGLTDALYNATENQGIASCPTAYSLSAAGSKTEAECYRQCTSADVAHSKSTGTFTGMFYSNNTNACEPVNDASCADGYHYKEGQAGLNVDASIDGGKIRWKSIGDTILGAGVSSSNDTTGLNNGDWDATFSYGTITGKARCSTKPGNNQNKTWTNPTTFDTLEDETGTGQYCYCQIDGFTPVDGSKQSLSGAWVFNSDSIIANFCSGGCANACVSGLKNDHVFRAALLGTVPSSAAMCEANTITINWDDVDPEYAGQNNEETATYGGDIRTPFKAATKKGQTFKGWKFSKPTQTTTGGGN